MLIETIQAMQPYLKAASLFMALALSYCAGALSAHRHQSFNRHPWYMRAVRMLQLSAVLTGYTALDPSSNWLWGALACTCFAVLMKKSSAETKKILDAQREDVEKRLAEQRSEFAELERQYHDAKRP
ncbi:MAG: hypothetical protein GY833_23075 [Aestuariibacter sp.]|nr:hypothetical protein [Aestuariibacter sp.]